MLLRDATNSDVESIVQILGQSRREYLPFAKSVHTVDENRNWVSKSLLPAGGVTIAALSGKDVGVLAISVSEGFGWIDQLYLAPGFVRQGIGSALLAHALDVLPRPVRLWTFQENTNAIAFYEHHGFKAIKRTNGELNEEKCPDVLYELN